MPYITEDFALVSHQHPMRYYCPACNASADDSDIDSNTCDMCNGAGTMTHSEVVTYLRDTVPPDAVEVTRFGDALPQFMTPSVIKTMLTYRIEGLPTRTVYIEAPGDEGALRCGDVLHGTIDRASKTPSLRVTQSTCRDNGMWEVTAEAIVDNQPNKEDSQ